MDAGGEMKSEIQSTKYETHPSPCGLRRGDRIQTRRRVNELLCG